MTASEVDNLLSTFSENLGQLISIGRPLKLSKVTQTTFTYSKLTIETLAQDAKYVQS